MNSTDSGAGYSLDADEQSLTFKLILFDHRHLVTLTGRGRNQHEITTTEAVKLINALHAAGARRAPHRLTVVHKLSRNQVGGVQRGRALLPLVIQVVVQHPGHNFGKTQIFCSYKQQN